MQHQNVIDNFIHRGTGGKGTYVKADRDILSSKFPQNYRPWGHWGWRDLDGQSFPLAVRLEDGSLLVNGARLRWPASGHQEDLLRALENTPVRFGVVPYSSITAAFTDGEVRDWNQQPIAPRTLQREVGIVVPSSGERWREVTEKDRHGRMHTRQVHTLGDAIVRIQDRFYASIVDETGAGSGQYCLIELQTHRPPATLSAALDLLKPRIVRDAEARGSVVRRQGEWYMVGTLFRTSELMRDVARGVAVFRQRHVLGKDGHHQLEEAVIYRVGPRKGEVYARGIVRHTMGDHHDVDLGTLRWYRVVRNLHRTAYTLSGGGTMAQFD